MCVFCKTTKLHEDGASHGKTKNNTENIRCSACEKNKTITSDVARLIAQRLETPPNVPDSDDDLDAADKNSDKKNSIF